MSHAKNIFFATLVAFVAISLSACGGSGGGGGGNLNPRSDDVLQGEADTAATNSGLTDFTAVSADNVVAASDQIDSVSMMLEDLVSDSAGILDPNALRASSLTAAKMGQLRVLLNKRMAALGESVGQNAQFAGENMDETYPLDESVTCYGGGTATVTGTIQIKYTVTGSATSAKITYSTDATDVSYTLDACSDGITTVWGTLLENGKEKGSSTISESSWTFKGDGTFVTDGGLAWTSAGVNYNAKFSITGSHSSAGSLNISTFEEEYTSFKVDLTMKVNDVTCTFSSTDPAVMDEAPAWSCS